MKTSTKKVVSHQTPETVSKDEEYFDLRLGHT